MLIEDYLMDEIIEAITEEFDLDEIEFSDTLHEVITDQYYSRDEAIRVLDELYDYEEIDSDFGKDKIGKQYCPQRPHTHTATQYTIMLET